MTLCVLKRFLSLFPRQRVCFKRAKPLKLGSWKSFENYFLGSPETDKNTKQFQIVPTPSLVRIAVQIRNFSNHHNNKFQLTKLGG